MTGTDEVILRIAERFRGRDQSVLSRRYDLADPGNLFLLQGIERVLLKTLVREGLWPLSDRRILDVGCGTGHFLRQLAMYGAEPDGCHGVDISAERLERARHLAPHHHHLCIDGVTLPYPDGHFDVVSQRTVFSSIDDRAIRERLAAEMVRVLRPGGLVLWYDVAVPNPWNPDLLPMREPEIRSLFPTLSCRFERVTLLPPLARLLAPLNWTLGLFLEAVPFLRGHRWGVFRHV